MKPPPSGENQVLDPDNGSGGEIVQGVLSSGRAGS
jgi:hypothetical protein